jgi:exonuclease VII small subunit
MIAPVELNGSGETEYRRHMRALEECARKLESMDLDPQEALGVCRAAEEHYAAVDRLLAEVEREVDEIQAARGARKAATD